MNFGKIRFNFQVVGENSKLADPWVSLESQQTIQKIRVSLTWGGKHLSRKILKEIKAQSTLMVKLFAHDFSHYHRIND